MKIKYFIVASCILFFQYHLYSQTVKIGNISISIDDSLELVIEKFYGTEYQLVFDTLKLSIRCIILKEVFNLQDNSNKSLQVIGYLNFFYIPKGIPFHYTKRLYEIEKVWSNPYSNDIPTLLNTINNIIEKNTIDRYSTELFQNKVVEPEYSSKTITIKLNAFTSLEIYSRDDNYFEIKEVITKDENRFSNEEYVLIFEDYKHYYSDKEYIIEYFQKEDDAEVRKRELLIRYLADSSEKPETKILRFYKDSFNYTK
jgi:hypothetical protein